MKAKLRQLHHAREARGWEYWQLQLFPQILGYTFHMLDTLSIGLAVVLEFKPLGTMFIRTLLIWNGVIVSTYAMIALGEVCCWLHRVKYNLMFSRCSSRGS